MPGSGRLALRTAIVVIPDPPHAHGPVVGPGEDVAVVDGDGVDGGVVRFHFADWRASFDVPQFEDAGAAAADDGLRSGQETQAGDPVFVRVVD